MPSRENVIFETKGELSDQGRAPGGANWDLAAWGVAASAQINMANVNDLPTFDLDRCAIGGLRSERRQVRPGDTVLITFA